MGHVLVLALVLLLSASSSVLAQQGSRFYVGGLAGVSTLSADAQSTTAAPDARVSLYKPENGLAASALAGMHLGRFVSVQTSYVWNRNDLLLLSSIVSPEGSTFYEQRRTSSQHLAIIDALVFVRARESRVRPYLTTGVGVLRFASELVRDEHVNGITPPGGSFTSTRMAFHVAVGIDVRLSDRSRFRYTYGELLSGNPVSVRLMPAGQRSLANFQSLFGWVWDL